MQRTRELINDVPIEEDFFDIQVFHDKDEDFDFFWYNGGGQVIEAHPAYSQHSYMEDWVSEGKWKYNDVNHKSRKTQFQIAPWPGLTADQSIYACDKTTLSEGSVVSRYSLREMIELGKLQLSRSTDTFTIQELTPLFRDSGLPHNVVIDRDPFETDFSIWYAVVDLVQLLSSFGLKGFAQRGVLLQSTKRARELGIHSKSLKARTAKDLADAHLAVRFGVLPTIDDAGGLISMVRNWALRYDQVKKILMDRFRKHSHVDLKTRNPQFQDWEETVMFNPGYGAASVMTLKCVVKQKVSWHGLALYGFTCPYFQGWLARLKQIIDSFGILDPAALWDVVPFSFIVDWFFTTQNWFHSLKPKLFPASAVVYDYLETLNHVITVEYYLSWFGPTEPVSLGSPLTPEYGSDFTNVYAGREIMKTYIRNRFLPTAVLGPLERGPSLKKSFVRCNRVAVSASLIAQRVPR